MTSKNNFKLFIFFECSSISADWKIGESEEKLFLKEQQVSYINLIRKKQGKKIGEEAY